MCGIAGFIGMENAVELNQIAVRMQESLVHRGPDDSGVWVDEAAGVALAHRRLAILDTSPAGHQPMLSSSGRYVIVFNGEIYNHLIIRAELEQKSTRRWHGHSDTEVLLEAFAVWGIEATLKRLIGMFAIALWDRQERLLCLMRDRIGEKPLYYGRVGGVVAFASELKALRHLPGWDGRINRNALALYLRYNYIPSPHTIYEAIYKLPAGTFLTLSVQSTQDAAPAAYWSAGATAQRGLGEPFTGSEGQAIRQLDGLLRDAVGRQMEADVPLGAFLSGGVDSSAVVALMQAQSSRSVRTFAIGFHEGEYDEAKHAGNVARHLGTDHTGMYISAADALEVIPRLPAIYDEPFSDPSQIPTFLIAQLTRQHVTVSLSGDGGDELFGGYNRYVWGDTIWEKVGWLPGGIRRVLSGCLRRLSPRSWDNLFRFCSPVLPGSFKQRTPGDKLYKLAEILDCSSPVEMYQSLVSVWKEPENIVHQAVEPATVLTDRSCWLATDDITLQMMYLDLVTYLQDDILVKVDRAAMAVGLETRVPFLDHRVVEFAWSIPLAMRIRNGQGKWLLRQVLYNYVPKALIERPKQGFGVPIDVWLRGPLRDWAESLLNEGRLQREGFLQPEPIRQKWREHLAGTRNWQHHLWNVLMFQAWLENERR